MPDYHFGVVEIIWAIIVAIFWFARLEFNVNQNKKEIIQLWEKNEDLNKELRDDLKTVSEELAEVKSSLSRIEGILSVRNKE